MTTVNEVHIDNVDFEMDDVHATGSVQSGFSTGCIVGTVMLVTIAVVGGGIGIWAAVREKQASTAPEPVKKPEPEKKPEPKKKGPEECPKPTPALTYDWRDYNWQHSVEQIPVNTAKASSGCFAVLGENYDSCYQAAYSQDGPTFGAAECRARMAALLDEQADHLFVFKVRLAKRVLLTDKMCTPLYYMDAKDSKEAESPYSKFFGGLVARKEICDLAADADVIEVIEDSWPVEYQLSAEAEQKFRLRKTGNAPSNFAQNAAAKAARRSLFNKVFEHYTRRLTDPANAEHPFEEIEVRALVDAREKAGHDKNILLIGEAEQHWEKEHWALSRELNWTAAGRDRLKTLNNDGYACSKQNWLESKNFIVKRSGSSDTEWERACVGNPRNKWSNWSNWNNWNNWN